MRILIASLLSVGVAFANNAVVNVYNWTGYMPPAVLKQFTDETGIQVNFSTFASNDELFAKIASADNQSGYDIVVPSANFVTRMRNLGMLEKIDHSKIQGLSHLNPDLMNQSFDPDNQYSIPYLWGITGIMVNRSYYPDLKLNSWNDLWNPILKDQILMLDQMSEPFEIAVKVLGFPPNTQNPEQIQKAYEKLVDLMPNIKLFNITAPQSILGNGDATIGVIFNGDAYKASQLNPNLQFIYPKEGAFIWIDNMTIPKNAPHLANAYKFINFMLRPTIAKEITEYSGFSSPNLDAIALLPKAVQDNTILYPPKVTLEKASFEEDLGQANTIYEYYWFLLKLQGE
jgi:spermidine/putrescine transport system substrate-binding protein